MTHQLNFASLYKRSKTSILWGGRVSDGQRALAKAYALELLRLSAGTERFRATCAMPRAERPAEIRRYAREALLAKAEMARLEKESRQKIVDALVADAGKVLDLFRSWDEDGDGEISRSEFLKAMPKLGVRAKHAQVRARANGVVRTPLTHLTTPFARGLTPNGSLPFILR